MNTGTYRSLSDLICARKSGIGPERLLLERFLKLHFMLMNVIKSYNKKEKIYKFKTIN